MRHAEMTITPAGAAPVSAADRVLARMFGASLDRQLAAGQAAESDRLLAARAQHIVSLPRRHALARDWEHLLDVARRAPTPAVPLCRDRIAAAEPGIRELVACLRAPLPVPAQGVAAASRAADRRDRAAVPPAQPRRPGRPAGRRDRPARPGPPTAALEPGAQRPSMARVMACRIHQVAYVRERDSPCPGRTCPPRGSGPGCPPGSGPGTAHPRPANRLASDTTSRRLASISWFLACRPSSASRSRSGPLGAGRRRPLSAASRCSARRPASIRTASSVSCPAVSLGTLLICAR